MVAVRHLHARNHASSGTYATVTGSASAITGNAPTLYDVNAMTPGAQASLMFKSALAAAGLSHAAAGEVLGVSSPRVTAKCHPMRPEAPVTVSDIIALAEAGDGAVLAGMIQGLQAVLDEVTGRASSVRAAALPMIAIQVCARASEAAEAANNAVIDDEITDADAMRVLERIGAVSRTLGVMQRSILRTRRVSR